MSPPPLKTIQGIDYAICDDGSVHIEQGYDTGNDGDVSVVNLHPTILRLIAEETGLVGGVEPAGVPTAIVMRLCIIRDRLSRLQDDLLDDDRQSQPFQTSEPWLLGGIVLADLDQLLDELGVPPVELSSKARTPAPVAAETSIKVVEQSEASAGTTGSLL